MPEVNLLTSFHFSVKLSGESSGTDAAFQEVSGLSQENTVEEVISGGENRFKYRLPSTTHYPNLVLKRGVATVGSPLAEWCQATLGGGLRNPIKTKMIIVSLLDNLGHPCMQWSFINAYPVKWAMSELKSQENNILIETIELAYQYFDTDDSRNDDEHTGMAAMFGGS
ncbi:phage tail protein [Pseudomonas syringae]|uniref:phage tail protein n=1 Tax=Pseudomonas syringae TaxID=317 RepID=UPI003F74FF82